MKTLRDYQHRIVNTIIDKKRLLLAIGMGMGKTISCLKAIEKVKPKRVLIVAPVNVAKKTWPDEIQDKDWGFNFTFTVINGTPAKRLKQITEDTEIHIINRENIVWLLENKVFDYDFLIWDESSSLKAAKMKTATKKLTRYAACLQFADKAEYVVLLSGTPTPNGIEDIYGQINTVKRNILGKSKYNFYQTYFKDTSWTRDFPVWKLMNGSFEKITDIIKDYVFKLNEEDHLELPELVTINVPVELDNKSKELYKKFARTMVMENDIDVRADNAAALFGKLQQLTGGAVYNNDEGYTIFHDSKIEALKELINESTSNMIVFYSFKHEKERIIENFKDAHFVSDENIEKWNRGEIPVLFAHAAQIGHGMNLQSGGNVTVWMSMPTSLELYQQANKRLHRSGQKADTVFIYHLISEGTIDQRIYEILQSKDIDQKKLMSVIEDISK